MCVRLGWRVPRLPRVARLPRCTSLPRGGLVPEVRELAEALCDALAGFEPGRYSGADCVALTELLSRTANSCQVAGARAATRVVGVRRLPRPWVYEPGRLAGPRRRLVGTRRARRPRHHGRGQRLSRDARRAHRREGVAGAGGPDHLGARGRGRAARDRDAVEPGRVAGGSSHPLAGGDPARHAARTPPRSPGVRPLEEPPRHDVLSRCAATRGGRPVREADGCRDRSGVARRASRRPRGHAGAVRGRRVRGARQRSGQARGPGRRHGDRHRPARLPPRPRPSRRGCAHHRRRSDPGLDRS